jgi:hypothetical protein
LDTHGFKEWFRNFIISIITAAATFLGQQKLYNLEEAKKGLWLSLVVFVSTFILLPVFELAWNFVRAPRKILEDENDQLQTSKDALEARLAEKLQSISPDKWIELSDRFKAAAGVSDFVYADWTRMSTGQEVWSIRGIGSQSECEVLCGLAGTMLLKSPNVEGLLSEKV